jgi:hypothetical protein
MDTKLNDAIADFSPVLRLIIHFNRAMDDQHWIEAIALAHMYIETQLRALLFKRNRETANPDEKVIALASTALEMKYISGELFISIRDFNKARNDAVHNIAALNKKYDGFRAAAQLASEIITQLQQLNEYWGQPPEKEEENDSIDQIAIRELLRKAKSLAKQYRQLTRKPLGITGEVGEVVAAKLLHLQLTDARNPGYDAIGPDGRKIQIKSRCLPPSAKPGQRMGKVKFDHVFDTVMLVLMDENYEPLEIFEARRDDVEKALREPGSISRNIRGALGLNKFKSIGIRAWPPR